MSYIVFNIYRYIVRFNSRNGAYVTCRGFGWTHQNTITFNNRVYSGSQSHGEHLLRSGINIHNHITIRSHPTVHMWRIPPEMRHWYQQYIFNHDHYYTTVQTVSPEQPRIRATAQFPQGLGSPPSSLLRLRETPYTTLLVFPALYPTSRLLSYPARAGIPNYEEGANTPFRTRPETPACGSCEAKIKWIKWFWVNLCMIICWKGIAFAGRCTQSGTHQWGSTKKIQVKHDLGRRLYGGQCQHKIGGAHLGHVGIAMHAW